MKTATSLALTAVGAILTFAVTANTSVFNLHVAGIVIMVTGLGGLLIPRKGYGWLRKRLIIPPLVSGEQLAPGEPISWPSCVPKAPAARHR